MRQLKEAFEESGLPIRVDVLDWHAISDAFKNVIAEEYEVIQEAKTAGECNGFKKIPRIKVPNIE